MQEVEKDDFLQRDRVTVRSQFHYLVDKMPPKKQGDYRQERPRAGTPVTSAAPSDQPTILSSTDEHGNPEGSGTVQRPRHCRQLTTSRRDLCCLFSADGVDPVEARQKRKKETDRNRK